MTGRIRQRASLPYRHPSLAKVEETVRFRTGEKRHMDSETISLPDLGFAALLCCCGKRARRAHSDANQAVEYVGCIVSTVSTKRSSSFIAKEGMGLWL